MSDIISRKSFTPQATPVRTVGAVAAPIADPTPIRAPRRPAPIQRQSDIPTRDASYSEGFGLALQNLGQSLGNFSVYQERKLAKDAKDALGEYQSKLLESAGDPEAERAQLDTFRSEAKTKSRIKAVDTLDGSLTAIHRGQTARDRIKQGDDPAQILAELAAESQGDLKGASDDFRDEYTSALQETVNSIREVASDKALNDAKEAAKSIALESLSSAATSLMSKAGSDPAAFEAHVESLVTQLGPKGELAALDYSDLDDVLEEAALRAAMDGNEVAVNAILDAERGDQPTLRHHAGRAPNVRSILSKLSTRQGEIETATITKFGNTLEIAAENGDLGKFLRAQETSLEELLQTGYISDTDYRRLSQVNNENVSINFRAANTEAYMGAKTLIASGKGRAGDPSKGIPALSVASDFWQRWFSDVEDPDSKIRGLMEDDANNERRLAKEALGNRLTERKRSVEAELVTDAAQQLISGDVAGYEIEDATYFLDGKEYTMPASRLEQDGITAAIAMATSLASPNMAPEQVDAFRRAQTSKIIAGSGVIHEATRDMLQGGPNMLGRNELNSIEDVPPKFLEAFHQFTSMVSYGHMAAAEDHAGESFEFYDYIMFLQDNVFATGDGLEDPDALFKSIQRAHESLQGFDQDLFDNSVNRAPTVILERAEAIAIHKLKEVPGLFNDHPEIRNPGAVNNWLFETAKLYLKSGVPDWQTAMDRATERAPKALTVRHGMVINKKQFHDLANNPEKYDGYEELINEAWAEQIAPKIKENPDDYEFGLVPAGSNKNVLAIRNLQSDDVFDAWMVPGSKRSLAFPVGVDASGKEVIKYIPMGARLGRADFAILEKAMFFKDRPKAGDVRYKGTDETILDATYFLDGKEYTVPSSRLEQDGINNVTNPQ